MADHTPGPWKWDGYDIRASNDEIILTSDGRFGSDADCHLIAAAPDLLAALKLALEMIEMSVRTRDPNWDGTVKDGRAISNARAAIAKAEGKS